MAYGSSAADRLARVREAIEAVLNGQEYYIGSRRLRRVDANYLFAQEQRLMDEVAVESGTSPFASVIQVDRVS